MLGITKLRRIGAIPFVLTFVGLAAFLFYNRSGGSTHEKKVDFSSNSMAQNRTGGMLLTFTAEEIASTMPYPSEKLLVDPPVPFVIKGTKDRPINSFWEESGRNALRTYLSGITQLTSNPTPKCHFNAQDKRRYATLINSPSKIYIAITLSDSEPIIPSLIHSLTTLIPLLGSHRVFVSVVEKGSGDMSAPLLRLLAKVLDALNVDYIISAHGVSTGETRAHGKVLPSTRNEAMQPLYDMPSNAFDVVLFMEDIAHCPVDALEVWYQQRLQIADMSCSIDWRPGPVVHGYDMLRSMGGNPYYNEDQLHSFLDGKTDEVPKLLTHLKDQDEWRRFTFLLPIQVLSCWSGITAIDARVFDSPNRIRFRGSTHIEAHLLSIDLWQKDIRRILVVPRASVAHHPGWYDEFRYSKQERLISDPMKLSVMERINWKPYPPGKVAYPLQKDADAR